MAETKIIYGYSLTAPLMTAFKNSFVITDRVEISSFKSIDNFILAIDKEATGRQNFIYISL